MVDVVLTQPVMQGDGVDSEVRGGLLDLAALAHERYSARTELRRVRAGACGEPSIETTD